VFTRLPRLERPMRQAALRRKITSIQERVTTLRTEISVLDEQILFLDSEVEDLHVRAISSETPLAVKEHNEAFRHAELAHRARRDALEQLLESEAERDALLRQVVEEYA